MKKFLLLLIVSVLFTFTVTPALAQQEYKEDKHFKKAVDYYNKGDYNKSVEEMRFVLDKYETTPKVWEIAIKIYFERYWKAPKGNSSEQLAQQLMNALKEVEKNGKKNNTIVLDMASSRDIYFNQLINVCREASLKVRDNYSSMYIRVLLVDKERKDSIPEKATNFMREAEENFQKENFQKALECYDKAIAEYPNYYKAILYKGDTYYRLKDYKNAVVYYKQAEAMSPQLLEPVKYLTDAYTKDELYEDAMNSCIHGIALYPDASMFDKLYVIADAKGKQMVDPWIKRKCYPNKSFVTPSQIATEQPWKAYQEARKKIQPFCDSTGAIITKNDLTSQQFMETYSWEELLKNTTDPQFDFAKKMQKEGYLDCYVFITMYHYDIHKQYTQFAATNEQRIKTFITKYLLTD